MDKFGVAYTLFPAYSNENEVCLEIKSALDIWNMYSTPTDLTFVVIAFQCALSSITFILGTSASFLDYFNVICLAAQRNGTVVVFLVHASDCIVRHGPLEQ